MDDQIKNNEIATFGAGCFWCVEAIFLELRGVSKVMSGYMGGENTDPTYREICSGQTGHAEVVQITYDPQLICFGDLLKVLWSTHDPTSLNRQGHDQGSQYRSAIFYHSEVQRIEAVSSKTSVARHLYKDPVVTEIVPAKTFYAAEKYHQDYYHSNPNNRYCAAVINPKVAKFRKEFANQLKTIPRILKTDLA